MFEVCERQDKGSIGAFYVRHHAELAGYHIDVADGPRVGYDVELASVHHCTDFPRLAAAPKRARWRIVGGHPMQNNPRPCIPYADAICIGEGESWIKAALRLIEDTDDISALSALPGTIMCKDWEPGRKVPSANIERPLPDNPPYLNRPGTLSAAWYIEMARGCPYRCDYCELGNSLPYRPYKREHLEKMIDACETGKTRKINFYAPDEASHPAYAEMYKYLGDKGYSAAFSSMRIESVLRNPPPLKNNHLIRVGIDGLTESTRRKVNKPITDQMIRDYFSLFIDRGHCNFKMFMIIGYPWETQEDFDEWSVMMDRLMSLPLKKNISLRIKWTPLIPQPCTPLAGVRPNYTWDMYYAVEEWHARHRLPQREPGWHVENDGLMSIRSHAEQCALTAGNEFELFRYRDAKPPLAEWAQEEYERRR